jgi:hypothetical protein
LSRIEKEAFFGTDLVKISMPGSVEVLGSRCFKRCRALILITFESRSKLLGNEKEILRQAGEHAWSDEPEAKAPSISPRCRRLTYFRKAPRIIREGEG